MQQQQITQLVHTFLKVFPYFTSLLVYYLLLAYSLYASRYIQRYDNIDI